MSGLKGRTSFELWHQYPPDRFLSTYWLSSSHFRTPTKSKIEPRYKEDDFVGYSEETKGYHLRIPSKKKIEISRDVKFFEERKIQISETSTECISIDCHFQKQVDSYENQKRFTSGDFLLIKDLKKQRYCDVNDVSYMDNSEDNERDTEENVCKDVESVGVGSENLKIGLRHDPGRPRYKY